MSVESRKAGEPRRGQRPAHYYYHAAQEGGDYLRQLPVNAEIVSVSECQEKFVAQRADSAMPMRKERARDIKQQLLLY
jgi:hypothetical protein